MADLRLKKGPIETELLHEVQIGAEGESVHATGIALVSRGITVGRVNSGEIVVSIHKDNQRILFDFSVDEFADFLSKCEEFCSRQRQPVPLTA